MLADLRVNRKIYFLIPILFALLTSILYFVIYRPAFNSICFTNLLLVFFAGLGWGGNIYLGDRGMIKLSYYYSAISIISPLIFFEFLRISPYDLYWHRVVILMIFAANLWLIVINKNKVQESKESDLD
ncbi:MAG: hypothetical protein ABFR75_12535 [Acidobacteriota bacterium]